jgi:hypothetical protein
LVAERVHDALLEAMRRLALRPFLALDLRRREPQELITTPLSKEPMDRRGRSALHRENEPPTEVTPDA